MAQNVGINYDFTNMEGILMSKVVVYQSGGFTNCGIGYRKFSQDELEEREKGNDSTNDGLAIINQKKYNKISHSINCKLRN